MRAPSGREAISPRSYQPSERSRHPGLTLSISVIFVAREPALICFSRLIAALAVGLLLALPGAGFGQIKFGLTGSVNTNYAVGVMGGASAAGSGITRVATTDDNIVITRATTPLPPVIVPMLTAQILPTGGMIFPPILLWSCPLGPDPGLAPFSPAGTVLTQGAY